MIRVDVARRRQAGVTLLIVGALMTTACAGPLEPLSVGTREFPTGVVLRSGADETPTALPLPPVSIILTGPSTGGLNLPAPVARAAATPDLPSSAPLASAAPVSCPSASPLVGPRLVAPNHVPLPPVPDQQFTFRNIGQFEETGPNARTVIYPDESARQVTSVAREDGAQGPIYRYDMVAATGDIQTTTSYTVVPLSTESAVPAAPGALPVAAGATPGLYVTKVVTRLPDGSEVSFQPQPSPGLLQLPFPAQAGTTWTAAGTDPLSQTTMAYTGTVQLDKARVDACGVVLDAIAVRLDGSFGPEGDQGVTVAPDGQTEFVADYAFATGYGGLLIADTVEATGTSGGVGFHSTNQATINSEPALPEPDCQPTC